MKFKNLAFCGILLATLITGCEKKDPLDQNILSSSNAKSYSFDLKTIDKANFVIDVDKGKWSFHDQKNKAVLLVFFATWCPPCKAEIPHLLNLKKQFGDKFEVVGVLVEDGKSNEEIKKFAEENGINYPITNSPENFVLASAIGGISSIPAMFLFNKNGYLIQDYVGIVPEEMLAIDVTKGLQ